MHYHTVLTKSKFPPQNRQKKFFPIDAGQMFFAPVYNGRSFALWSQKVLDFYYFGEILDLFRGGNLLFWAL